MSADEVNVDVDAEKAVREPLTAKEDESTAKVQFVTSTAGDAKNGEVNIVTSVSPRKSGLSKEELMKYANDPFWVRLRLALFILFWIIWFGMLIGAIVIIIVVPKCPPSSRLKWYQKTSMYEVNVKSLVNGLQANFNHISKLAMESIVLNSFHGRSFTELKSEIGTDNDFKRFVELAEKKGKKVIMAFDFRYTSIEHEWFIKSMTGDPEYEDYYLTTDNVTIANRIKNWAKNESVYYYAPNIDGKPDNKFATLNFKNKKVVKEVKNVIKFWKEQKVNGFELLNADDFLPDAVYPNSTDENVDIVSRLRKHLYTKVDVSGKTGFFAEVHNQNEIKHFVGEPDSKISDLIVTDFFTAIKGGSKAKEVKKVIDDHYNSLPKWAAVAGGRYGPWLGCRISTIDQSVEKSVGTENVNTAFMLFYMLPNCTIMLTAGDELQNEDGEWISNATYNGTRLELVSKLGEIRRKHIDALLMGTIEFPFEDEDVLTIARYYPGFEGFLLISNFADQEKTLTLKGDMYLPETGSVVLASSETPKPEIGKIALKGDLMIGRKQSVLIQFTPTVNE